MLYHDDIPWSGTFDMVTQNDKLAMVDIKTGEHYKAHDIQLNMYRILWNKIFPDFKIETIQGLYLKGKWIKQLLLQLHLKVNFQIVILKLLLLE